MSKITSDGLTRSGTGCFIATVGVKGLIYTRALMALKWIADKLGYWKRKQFLVTTDFRVWKAYTWSGVDHKV